MSWSALVLAGNRRADCAVAAAAGVSHKALAPIAGRPMIERVISTLRALPRIESATVVIEDAALLRRVPALRTLLDEGWLRTLPASDTPSTSARAGVEALGLTRPVLLLTADIPLLTPEMLLHFLDHQPSDIDATVALARLALVKAAHPGAVRTGLAFSDGPWSGCNLFAFHDPAAGALLRFWRRVEENRKRPLAMLRQLGLVPALRYATRTLPLDAALATLGARTGTRLASVDMPFAEAAIDVDKPADMVLAEAILTAREAPALPV